MKPPRFAPVVLAVCGLDLVVQPQVLRADLIAYEPYDYVDGADLSNQSGGTGWGLPWTDTVGDTAILGSLQYADSLGNSLVTSGNKAYYNGSGGTSSPYRDLPSVLGADGTTTWVSFLGQRIGPLHSPPTYYRAGNFSLFNRTLSSSTEQLAIGEGTNMPADTWALVPDGSAANGIPSSVPFDALSLLVVRIDHLAGNDNAYLFVNPILGAEPEVAQADVQSLGAFDFSLNSVRPFAGNPHSSGYPHAELLLDEIRIGETFADVTPFTPIPEPGVAAMLALGGALLAWRRSRR